MTGQRKAAGVARQPQPSSRSHRKGSRPVLVAPAEGEVVEAVKSLYADELQPFGRILLRRVRERLAARRGLANVEDAPLVDPKALQTVCAACRRLQVEAVDGNEVLVMLSGTPAPYFVDVSSTVDPYPAGLWASLSRSLTTLQGPAALLPGGRYACAQALVAMRFPCFGGLSLGQVCHVVQLAVSQRKLLGYAEGHMVPYALSEEARKEEATAWKPRTPAPEDQTALPVATLQDVRACLAALLNGDVVTAEPGPLGVSTLKSLFRFHFGVDVQEGAFGHSRLVDLLRDPRLQDICELKSSGTGQIIVVPSQSPSSTVFCGRFGDDSYFTAVDNCWGTLPLPKVAQAPLASLAPPPGLELPAGLPPPPGLGFEGFGGLALPVAAPAATAVTADALAASLRSLLELKGADQQAALLQLASQRPGDASPEDCGQYRSEGSTADSDGLGLSASSDMDAATPCWLSDSSPANFDAAAAESAVGRPRALTAPREQAPAAKLQSGRAARRQRAGTGR